MKTSVTNATPVFAPRVKPARFKSYRERFDFIHENMQPTLSLAVLRTDDLFRQEDVWLDPPDCRFRLSFESETRLMNGRQDYRFWPNLDADIELPNLAHRWKVYIRSREHNLDADLDEADEGRVTRFGITQMRKDLHLDADAGVRLHIRPEAYTRLSWSRAWTPRYWVIKPGERLFLESDEGFGEVSSLTIHRWLGRRPRVFIQSSSQVKISQSTKGAEFAQIFRLGRLTESLEPMDTWTRVLGDRDIARGGILKAGAYGHSENETVVDEYRFGYVHRHPFYKKWIYLTLNPELVWERDLDWEIEYRLRLSVDMLFWGSLER